MSFFDAMKTKETIDETKRDMSDYCGRNFDDRGEAAACRVGVSNFASRLSKKIESDVPEVQEENVAREGEDMFQ